MDWQQLIVKPDDTILDALRIIDKGAMQIALVVSDNLRLVGTVTDGDVRRGILDGVSLDSPVSVVMNQKPIVALNSKPHSECLEKMKSMEILQLPVVDESNKLVGVRFLKELVNEVNSKNTVVLMAGGIGSRLKPLTDNCPKPMLQVGGKPILESIINSFTESGFKDFVLSVNYHHELIEDYFGDGSKFGVNIEYIREGKELGTAGSLSLIPFEMKAPFFVMNADLLTGLNYRQLLAFHKDHNAVGTMCVQHKEFQVPFGVVELDKHKIVGIKEKPVQSYFVNTGIYVLDPVVLPLIDSTSYLDMPTLFERIIENGKSVSAFAVRENWMDIGRHEDYDKAQEIFANQT